MGLLKPVFVLKQDCLLSKSNNASVLKKLEIVHVAIWRPVPLLNGHLGKNVRSYFVSFKEINFVVFVLCVLLLL